MVGKLLKYELKYIFRSGVIPLAIMFILAIITRISLLLTQSYEIVPVTLIFYFVFVFISAIYFAFAGITRFYTTLFTREGYMTLSLPVSTDKLIISKLLSAVISAICGSLLCALSVFIAFVSSAQMKDLTVQLFDMLSRLFPAGWQSNIGLMVEYIILQIVSLPEMYLFVYLVLSVGQLVTVKNRTVVSVLILVAALFVWGIIYSIIGLRITVALEEVSVYLYLAINIIVVLAVDFACYFLVRYIIKHKMNLIA